MIISLEKYKIKTLLKNILYIFQTLYFSIFEVDDSQKQFKDLEKLKSIFQDKYPLLKVDENGSTSCVSCKLCEIVCPEDAIKVNVANFVNYPASLRIGEPPKNFFLNFDSCIKCGYCSDVCLVHSIDMKNNYSSGKRDLTKQE